MPEFGDFLPDGTLAIKFDPPTADVPQTWKALWDDSWTSKLTQYDRNRYLE